MRGYLLAVEDYSAQDVEAGVTALIKGVAPGVNPNFLPPPAAVGSECHRQNHLRATAEDLARRLRPALPPPLIVHSPESRANVKAVVEAMEARNAERKQLEAETQRRSEVWAKTNERFHPDMDPEAVKRRLGFTAGDPEGDRDVA